MLTHHIPERRIHGNRILGNRLSQEAIVLRTRTTRFQILTHRILECSNQGNRILGNRIQGNRLSQEAIVLRTLTIRF